MSIYRNGLPQLGGHFFLTDAGLETDLIFNAGLEIPCFAAHTLLAHERGRAALESYFSGFLDLAREMDAGFILDTVTWRANVHWLNELGTDEVELKRANAQAVEFAESLRAAARNPRPIVINAPIGPRGDAYRPEHRITAEDAELFFARQLDWLAKSGIDMVSALTFNQSAEAIGLLRAAQTCGLPAAVSFTVETDGRLPDGEPIGEAIEQVDAATGAAAAYFMINCAHPDHFAAELDPAASWSKRLRGIRANASRCSHAELDEAEELDAGDPEQLAGDYRQLVERLPWLNIFGGCCGSDLRHVRAIAEEMSRKDAPA